MSQLSRSTNKVNSVSSISLKKGMI